MRAKRRRTPPFLRRIKQERNNRILADVFGDIFFGVVRPHLFLVDVLLKDVAQHIRVNFVLVAERAIV